MTACVARRFWAKVDTTDPSGCWLWTGAVDPQTGYGRMYVEPSTLGAHRVAYLLLVGDIPEGQQLDHLCRVRRCVRPDHLEPVTQRENLLRGETLAAAHSKGVDCGFAGCKTCRRFQVAS